MQNKVYIAIGTDILHQGHINLIKKASELGDVIVGVLTDEVVASYKRMPLIDYKARKEIIENIKGVSSVVEQNTIYYSPNLELLRPAYVMHGDNWVYSFFSEIRADIINTLAKWGGKLIEIPYTEGVSLDKIDTLISQDSLMPEFRRSRLRKALSMKQTVRAMEAHSGLSALIVENSKVLKDKKIKSFDAIWLSSLTDSTAKGKPDIELIDMTSRINSLNQIMEVTTLPIIMDGDTGGLTEHFVYNVKTLERLGVSAIIIEDKVGLKKNSLFGTDVDQTQDAIEHFCLKITAGRSALQTSDFMIFARIESLILKKGMTDALQRAKSYVKAGAHGIMIHSKEKSPVEIFEFCDSFRTDFPNIPLIVVPTTFNQTYENDLQDHGINIVIYANQLIRSAYPAMTQAAEMILTNERAYEADDLCMPIKEILTLIPGAE